MFALYAIQLRTHEVLARLVVAVRGHRCAVVFGWCGAEPRATLLL
jgi:hypothetical protein